MSNSSKSKMFFSKLSCNFFLALAITTAAVTGDDAVEHQMKDLAGTNTATKTYIVTFADDAISPAKQCEALALFTGGSVDHVYDHLNGCSMTMPVTQQVQAQTAFTALRSNPSVMNVEFDQMVYAMELPSDGIFSDAAAAEAQSEQVQASAVAATSWGLDRIDQCALPLNNLMTKQDATGVEVFILDTGIRGDHVEFANGVLSTDDCHFSGVAGENAMVDGSGHG
jgi:subtilisin family serine protease